MLMRKLVSETANFPTKALEMTWNRPGETLRPEFQDASHGALPLDQPDQADLDRAENGCLEVYSKRSRKSPAQSKFFSADIFPWLPCPPCLGWHRRFRPEAICFNVIRFMGYLKFEELKLQEIK